MRTLANHVSLENVGIHCSHCETPMESYTGSGGAVRYFRCKSCQRWVSSTYAEVLQTDAQVSVARPKASEAGQGFDTIKARLERFLASLEANDPYHQLGVSPRASAQEIRERYRSLARAHHPDCGGDTEAMVRVNESYSRILRRQGR